MKGLRADWLVWHERAEKRLYAALLALFADAADEIRVSLRPFLGTLSPATLDSVFPLSSMRTAISALATKHMEKIVREGAIFELGYHLPGKQGLAWRAATTRKKLPPAVETAIAMMVVELVNQAFWNDIPEAFKAAIAAVIFSGNAAGWSAEQMRLAIENVLIADAENRAARIALSETTGALSGGQSAARVLLVGMEIVATKMWHCRFVNSREAHMAAHNQIVAATSDFVVGGEVARFPCDPRLSAWNRCNCRCSSISLPPQRGEKPVMLLPI